MHISDVRLADIILFESDGKPIDLAISLLSDSNITHAALCFREGVLADAGPTGIALHQLTDDPKGRSVHLRRLPCALRDPQPVLSAANYYVSQREPFDYSGMVLLALLLLFRKEAPSTAVTRWTLAILKRLANRLDAAIQLLADPSKHPMFCSQFVYTCFRDASAKHSEYGLSIENGCLSTTMLTPASLLSRASAMRSNDRAASIPVPLSEFPEHAGLSDQDLAQGLLGALIGQNPEATNNTLENELIDTVVVVDRTLARIWGSADWIPGRLFLHQLAPLFVTPSDLYAHCPSLHAVDAGELKVFRDANNLPLGAQSREVCTTT